MVHSFEVVGDAEIGAVDQVDQHVFVETHVDRAALLPFAKSKFGTRGVGVDRDGLFGVAHGFPPVVRGAFAYQHGKRRLSLAKNTDFVNQYLYVNTVLAKVEGRGR